VREVRRVDRQPRVRRAPIRARVKPVPLVQEPPRPRSVKTTNAYALQYIWVDVPRIHAHPT
jgi:hypothetical protein